MNNRKIALAVEECLLLMDHSADAAAYVSETEYLSLLQANDSWTNSEIKAVQHWVKQALDERDCRAHNPLR